MPTMATDKRVKIKRQAGGYGAIVYPNVKQRNGQKAHDEHDVTEGDAAVNGNESDEKQVQRASQESGGQVADGNHHGDGRELALVIVEEVVDGANVTAPGDEESHATHQHGSVDQVKAVSRGIFICWCWWWWWWWWCVSCG